MRYWGVRHSQEHSWWINAFPLKMHSYSRNVIASKMSHMWTLDARLPARRNFLCSLHALQCRRKELCAFAAKTWKASKYYAYATKVLKNEENYRESAYVRAKAHQAEMKSQTTASPYHIGPRAITSASLDRFLTTSGSLLCPATFWAFLRSLIHFKCVIALCGWKHTKQT